VSGVQYPLEPRSRRPQATGQRDEPARRLL
jgi:hypothetical protein